jgi:hypothetical protein
VSDLEARIASRKLALISELKEHKKNPSRAGAAEAAAQIHMRLTELAYLVTQPRAETRLGQWLLR